MSISESLMSNVKISKMRMSKSFNVNVKFQKGYVKGENFKTPMPNVKIWTISTLQLHTLIDILEKIFEMLAKHYYLLNLYINIFILKFKNYCPTNYQTYLLKKAITLTVNINNITHIKLIKIKKAEGKPG